jgi:flagellar FliL protein
MADEVAKEEAPAKKGGNALMMVLIALIVLLIGAVGAIGYFIYSKGMLDENPQNAKDEAKAAEKEDANGPGEGGWQIAKVENLVLNITNAKGREKLMKLSFSLKSTEPTISTIVESNNAEIVDAVIAQISARTSEELLTVGGKALLKEEMLDEINAIVNEASKSNEEIKKNNIKKLFFTTFVIK